MSYTYLQMDVDEKPSESPATTSGVNTNGTSTSSVTPQHTLLPPTLKPATSMSPQSNQQ